MKKNRYTSARVKCPYYKSEDTHKIYCKGVQEDTALHLAFAFPAEKADYREECCIEDYEGCPIYQMLSGGSEE